MGRKVPFWHFSKRSLPNVSKFKHKIFRKIIRKRKKRQPPLRFNTKKMKGILKNGSCPIKYENAPVSCGLKTVRFGTVKYYANYQNPNRTLYMLALRQRNARRNVGRLAANKLLRRAERAACKSNGLHCDASGNVYPFMTNMRTFINSARNAVLMKGYTAARKALFKAKNIIIKPPSKIPKIIRFRSATI